MRSQRNGQKNQHHHALELADHGAPPVFAATTLQQRPRSSNGPTGVVQADVFYCIVDRASISDARVDHVPEGARQDRECFEAGRTGYNHRANFRSHSLCIWLGTCSPKKSLRSAWLSIRTSISMSSSLAPTDPVSEARLRPVDVGPDADLLVRFLARADGFLLAAGYRRDLAVRDHHLRLSLRFATGHADHITT